MTDTTLKPIPTRQNINTRIQAQESDRPQPPQLPTEAPRAYPRRTYEISVTDADGWPSVITYYDLTIDQFEEIKERLKERGYRPAGAAPTVQDAPAAAASAPICPVHTKPMKPMNKPDRTGKTHWCTAKHGDGFCGERA